MRKKARFPQINAVNRAESHAEGIMDFISASSSYYQAWSQEHLKSLAKGASLRELSNVPSHSMSHEAKSQACSTSPLPHSLDCPDKYGTTSHIWLFKFKIAQIKKCSSKAGGCQRGGAWGNEWNGWRRLKVQTSSYKINESWGWNVQQEEYSQFHCYIFDCDRWELDISWWSRIMHV